MSSVLGVDLEAAFEKFRKNEERFRCVGLELREVCLEP